MVVVVCILMDVCLGVRGSDEWESGLQEYVVLEKKKKKKKKEALVLECVRTTKEVCGWNY